MEDKNKEEAEETDSGNLRDLILQQLSTLEPSETSDDDSYKARLSCILEDDESESGTAALKEFPKEVEKATGRNNESEKGPPEAPDDGLGTRPADVAYDGELGDEFAREKVQVTDLDDVALCEASADKTEDGEESDKNAGFAIKKLKSSDDVHRRPVVVRRRELSSDSSDLDISVSNSAEGPSSDLKIVELEETEDENTLALLPRDNVYGVESETSADEDSEQPPKEGEVEVVDNETLSTIFAKVSRTYLEKTKGNVKWEESEKIDRVFKEVMEEMAKAKGDQLSFRDVHIRGTSPREYNPPVPPETYLWEELKRLRERGGYPWTYLDKPPFDEATWKKYICTD